MNRLLVVRHGNTFEPSDVPLRLGCRTDLPLVAAGLAQVAAVGRAFAAAGVRADALLSGPLRRTRQTASAIAAALAPFAPPVRIEPWLAEVDHGLDEGRPDAEVVARIGPAALERWEREGVPPPGWIDDRAVWLAAWRWLIAASAGTTIVCTSNGVARFALLAHPALARAAADLPTLKLRTGAWGEVRCDGGAPRLVAWDVRPAD